MAPELKPWGHQAHIQGTDHEALAVPPHLGPRRVTRWGWKAPAYSPCHSYRQVHGLASSALPLYVRPSPKSSQRCGHISHSLCQKGFWKDHTMQVVLRYPHPACLGILTHFFTRISTFPKSPSNSPRSGLSVGSRTAGRLRPPGTVDHRTQQALRAWPLEGP